VTPEQMIFLDDAPSCVEGARAVGIAAVLFETNAQAIAAIDDWLRKT
jgi:FMN phosphatase YigB (HAD superfamily)